MAKNTNLEKEVERLELENAELKQLARFDALTGLYNRRETEKRITELMENGPGALLIGDLNYFKKINDEHGHLVGDGCLKKAANLLRKMTRSSDVVGRIGGDEFVVYLVGCDTEDLLERLCTRFTINFNTVEDDEEIKLSICIAGSLLQEGDTYKSLFDRADQLLIEKKQAIHKRRSITGHLSESSVPDNWVKDLNDVRRELIEEIKTHGAYCPDFNSFKSIYRFLERAMIRSHNKASLLLFSLTSADGESFTPSEKENEMLRLGNILQKSIRMGDVYTKYTSGQYLVLLINTEEGDAKLVGERIRKQFLEDSKGSCLLVHYSFKLEKAKVID